MMKEAGLLMGVVAKQAGVNRETKRYDERTGLLQKPMRTHSGYRVYSPEAVARVEFDQSRNETQIVSTQPPRGTKETEGDDRGQPGDQLHETRGESP